MAENTEIDNVSNKYLVFQMGEELFATPLIEVREVVEFHQPKPIPNMASFFRGVVNIRGEIIGVIDLRERMGIQGSDKMLCQLVFETPTGPLAAIVDRVHSVVVMDESQLERRANVSAQTQDRAYFVGVGKVNDQIVTFISLPKTVSPEQMTAFQ